VLVDNLLAYDCATARLQLLTGALSASCSTDCSKGRADPSPLGKARRVHGGSNSDHTVQVRLNVASPLGMRTQQVPQHLMRARHPAAEQRHTTLALLVGQARQPISYTCDKSPRGCRLSCKQLFHGIHLLHCVQGCHQVWAVQPCLPLQHAWCWCIQNKVDKKHMGPRRAGVPTTPRIACCGCSTATQTSDLVRMQQLCSAHP
jgi:hypothetical protein